MKTSTLSRAYGAQLLFSVAIVCGALVAPVVHAQSVDSTVEPAEVVLQQKSMATVVADSELTVPESADAVGKLDKKFFDFSFKDFDVKDALKNSRLSVNGISYHFDRKNPHNERNWGLGLEVPLSDDSYLMIGRYKNSNWKQTNYAWYVNQPWSIGRVQLGWMAGLATGYHSNPNSPMFVGGLAATIRNDKVGVNVICLPPALCAANLVVKVW